MEFDVIILGGGIIGASSAYQLAKSGLRVALFDSRPFGLGASGNSAAMLEFQLDAHRGDPFVALAAASMKLFPALYEEVKRLTGIDFQYERCGIVQLALNEQEAGDLRREALRQKESGWNAEWLSAETLSDALPHLALVDFGGIRFNEDGQVNGEKFLSGMIAAAKNAGAHVQDDMGPLTLQVEKGAVAGVETSDGAVKSQYVVIAAGAWTDNVLEPLNTPLGIEPIRGQLVVYEAKRREFPLPVYTKSGGYITPKQDGYALAGTTVERVGFDSATTKEGETLISNLAQKLFPHLSTAQKRGVTAGLRPKSADDLPIIGPLPDHPNVIVAAGHYRNGVLLAPITALIVRSLILGEKPPVPIDPFLPGRFLAKI